MNFEYNKENPRHVLVECVRESGAITTFSFDICIYKAWRGISPGLRQKRKDLLVLFAREGRPEHLKSFEIALSKFGDELYYAYYIKQKQTKKSRRAS